MRPSLFIPIFISAILLGVLGGAPVMADDACQALGFGNRDAAESEDRPAIRGQFADNDFAGEVLFAPGSAELSIEARERLRTWLGCLQSEGVPVFETYIVGHTDITGHADSTIRRQRNQALSEARASAVQGWLETIGFEAQGDITVIGRGDLDLLCEPDAGEPWTAELHRCNRRVEIFISNVEDFDPQLLAEAFGIRLYWEIENGTTRFLVGETLSVDADLSQSGGLDERHTPDFTLIVGDQELPMRRGQRPAGDDAWTARGNVQLLDAGEFQANVRAVFGALKLEGRPIRLQVTDVVPTLRVPSPAQGESLYFSTRRELRAEVQGVEVDQVRFSLSVAGEEIFSRDVDVQTEGPTRTALLPVDIPTLPLRSSARLAVRTLGGEPVLSREIDVILESEPASISIIMPEGREPHINRETPIQLDSNAAITNIRWNFGEGWVDGTAAMRHSWNRYGNFQLQAEATGSDGSRLIATPVDIIVPVRQVEASGKLIYRDRVVGSEVTKVPRRSTLQLVDESVGDIVEKRWRVNGAELRSGQSAVTVDEYGAYEIELTVIGTPQAGVDQVIIAFQTNDRFLFWVYTIVLLIIIALFAKLLLGNKWRHAEFGTQRIAKSDGDPGAPDIRKKGLLTGRNRVGSWNFWTKSAHLSLAELDDTVCKNWQPTDQLLFKPRGRDIPLSWVKGSHNHHRQIAPTPEQTLRGWERRWRIQRPLNQDDDARSGAIFLRHSRNINPLRRWWPEFGFFIVVCTALYTLRHFVATLY